MGKRKQNNLKKAKKCHICEDNLKNTTKIDHLGRIQKWLKIMRLPNRYPSESDVKEQVWRPTLNIPEHVFTQAKEKLSKYRKDNNNKIYCERSFSLDRKVQRSSTSRI